MLARGAPEYRNLAIMNTVTISDATMVQRTTDGKPVRVYIHAKYIKIVNGAKFMQVTTRDYFIAKLFGVRGRATNREHIMHHTDVVEQLVECRNSETHNQICNISGHGDTEDLWANKRLSADIKLQLPQVIEINTPIIGPVSSVRMTVLCTANKRAALYMKLTDTNIEYCSKACMHQIESGGVKRKKRRITTSGSPPPPSQPSSPLADAVSPLPDDAPDDENASSSPVSASSSSVGESPVVENMPDVQQLCEGARPRAKITDFFAKR